MMATKAPINYLRTSDKKCDICSSSSDRILSYFMIGILIILSIHLQFQLTYQDNILQILVTYVRKMGLLPIGTSGIITTNFP
jgi:hypothetical protein